MPNETAKVEGQLIPYKDMHGIAYGVSDTGCNQISLGRHQKTNTIQKGALDLH